MANKGISRFISSVIFVGFAWNVTGGATEPLIPVNPANASGATEFDWQEEWGTIHMNSMADGLNDPGSLANQDGNVGCAIGKLCVQMKTTESNRSNAAQLKGNDQIKNAIKFDIKNSLLNCMSRIAPTLAINNPWDSKTTVCLKSYGYNNSVYGDPLSLVYTPLWDKRANDDRAWNYEGFVGCQQAISNNCVRDMHDCVEDKNGKKPEDNEGYKYPVTHVFSPEEVNELGGRNSQLPSTYYSYEKITSPEVLDKDGKVTKAEVTQRALSVKDPSHLHNVKPGSVKKIEVKSDPNLARLKSYEVKNKEDKSSFIVIDPSDFFDLRLYAKGGKHDSGYNQTYVDNQGRTLVQTYDSCPALGLTSGYSGICDPTGQAGCNLPIYYVGPTTKFNSADGKTYSYSDYPIKWSGYVKKWAVISVEEYLKNIKGRENYYLDGNFINRNPIFMFTRSDEYCEAIERTSAPSTNGSLGVSAPDLPCIQYVQYQQTDKGGNNFEFVDLYNPVESDYADFSPEYNNIQLYDRGIIDPKTGEVIDLPDTSKPVLGTGTDIYIGGKGLIVGYVSFADREAGEANAKLLNAQLNASVIPFSRRTLFTAYRFYQPMLDLISPKSAFGFGAGPYWWSQVTAPAPTPAPVIAPTVQATRPPEVAIVPPEVKSQNPVVDPKYIGVYRNHKKEREVQLATKAASVIPVYYPAVTRAVYVEGPLKWDRKTGALLSGIPQYNLNEKGPDGKPKRAAGAGEHLGKFKVEKEVVNPRTGLKEKITEIDVIEERGIGVNLEPGNLNVVRLKAPTKVKGQTTTCVVMSLSPSATKKLFIQTNSESEYIGFLNEVSKGTNPAFNQLSVRACTAKYMSSTRANKMTNDPIPQGSSTWVGMMSCDSLATRPACNQSKMISAERYCELENGSLTSCDACAGAVDPDLGRDYSNKAVGGHVLVSPIADGSKCYFSASCYNNSATGCPSAGTSGGHVFCFAPETKITMADGQEKAIRDVKPGDEVLSFNGKNTRNSFLNKARVVATATTEEQKIIQINNLKLTPLHKIILASGRAVVAQDIKVGDQILNSKGFVEVVETKVTDLKPIKVYNLVLEDGSDGYIANGIRVMSYPLLKGMDIVSSLDSREKLRSRRMR